MRKIYINLVIFIALGIYFLTSTPKIIFAVYFTVVHHGICLWVLFHGGAHRLEESRIVDMAFGWFGRLQDDMLMEDFIKLFTWCYLIGGDFFAFLYLIS